MRIIPFAKDEVGLDTADEVGLEFRLAEPKPGLDLSLAVSLTWGPESEDQLNR